MTTSKIADGREYQTNVTGTMIFNQGSIELKQGGTVTQLTSRATGATINGPSGVITMDDASLAAAAEATFTVTNSFVEADDVVVVCLSSGHTTGTILVWVSDVAAGSFDVTVANLHASTAGTTADTINFVVIKAS